MEVLKQLCACQDELEDAFMLESTPEEVKETKDGVHLLRYLRRRRRIIDRIVNTLNKHLMG